MSRGPSPIIRRRRLGADLRRLREAAGLTGEQVIARIGWASASKLSRLENGRSRPDLSDVLDLLDVYGVAGAGRDELVAVARDAGNTRGWLREYPVMTQRQRGYAELESASEDIREYAPAAVPGLLQTPAYARVRILSSRPLQPVRPTHHHSEGGFDPEAEVAARLARQAILSRATDPPQYEAVLDEASIAGRGGPTEVMRAQLTHLRRLAQLPNVTVRLLLNGTKIGDHYLPHTAFSLYRFADPEDPETVGIEALANDMIITERPYVARYARVFDWLRTSAMGPDESLEWLVSAADPAGRRAPRPRRSDVNHHAEAG